MVDEATYVDWETEEEMLYDLAFEDILSPMLNKQCTSESEESDSLSLAYPITCTFNRNGSSSMDSSYLGDHRFIHLV